MDPDIASEVVEAIRLDGGAPYATVEAIRKPNQELISRTDLECLEETVQKYNVVWSESFVG